MIIVSNIINRILNIDALNSILTYKIIFHCGKHLIKDKISIYCETSQITSFRFCNLGNEIRCIKPLMLLDLTLPFARKSEINLRRKINEIRLIKCFDCFRGLNINVIDIEYLRFLVILEKLSSSSIQFLNFA